MKNSSKNLAATLQDISQCRLCEGLIPEPRPVLRASKTARLLIVGQAPGTKVHESGIPWNDASGRRLRSWLGIEEDIFYDDTKVAIVPMGFCYPGKGSSGDLPPRPECAATWHSAVLSNLPDIECKLLIGMYAQNYYLDQKFKTLTDTVRNWREFAPEIFVLPHPSPRNQLWLKRNEWFERETIPALQTVVRDLLY